MSPIAILLIVCGVLAVAFSLAYLLAKDKKASMGFERNLKDRDIIKRLLRYARPYVKYFVLVLVLLLLSVAYEIISPLIMGRAEQMITEGFEMKDLLLIVALSAGLLTLSMLARYYQAVVLQRTGQRIITSIRDDVFSHTLSLSQGQLNSIPVGKLVTRVSGDVGAISQLFTDIVVNLLKNAVIIVGVLAAMLILNWRLTAVVMMFTPPERKSSTTLLL